MAATSHILSVKNVHPKLAMCVLVLQILHGPKNTTSKKIKPVREHKGLQMGEDTSIHNSLGSNKVMERVVNLGHDEQKLETVKDLKQR